MKGNCLPPLDCGVPELLNTSIAKFLAEIQPRKVGAVYKARTYRNMFHGLGRYLKDMDSSLDLMNAPEFAHKKYPGLELIIRIGCGEFSFFPF